MALEDRCSPQSAPSPPGVPHSPQTMLATPNSCDMNSYTTQCELSLTANDQITTELTSKQEPLMDMDDDIDEQCDDIDHPPQIQPISFSIMNILSDKFGGQIRMKSSNESQTKKESLFRPFETTEIKTEPSPRPPFGLKSLLTETQLAQIRIAQALEYSRTHGNYCTEIPDVRNQLFSPFTMASYPKIHEEIMNNKKYQTTKLTEAALSKIPPLGGLCKTVSQIGQAIIGNSNLITKNDVMSATQSSLLADQQQQQSTLYQHGSRDSGMESSDDTKSECSSTKDENGQKLWPAWVYCTRYSDRPSSGPRYRRPKKPKDKTTTDDKRPRTAFSSEQLARLKREFNENRYLTERRRQQLSSELGLNEAQIKIWFQNKRAKIKKTSGNKNPLALQLMAQGLYNHSTVPLTKEEEELEMRMNGQLID